MFPVQLQANTINELFAPINNIFELLREATTEATRQISELLANGMSSFF